MPSVLETFFILFESDASDAKKEVDSLDKSLDDVEKTAGKSVDASDKAGDAFLEMGRSAIGAIAGVFALGSIISGTMAKAQQIDDLGKFSRVIGENVGDVNAWEEAVIRAGGTADSFRQSVASLNEKVVDASVKGFNEIVPFFNQLGISIVDANGKAKSTLELLPQLATAFESISEQESSGLGKKLGLDQGTILLLQAGRKEVEAMIKRQRELGVVSKESVAVSEKFNDQMSDLRQVMGFASQSMLINVLPAVTAVLEVFTDLGSWMGENQTLVEGFFIGIGFAVLKFALPSMISLAAAVWTVVAPFLAVGLTIAAVGAAFALLYEDVVAFMDGQDSLIGQMSEKWPIVGDIVKGIVGFVKNFISAMSGLGQFLIHIFTDPQKALEKFLSVGNFINDFIAGLFGFGDNDIDVNINKTEKDERSGGLFDFGDDQEEETEKTIIQKAQESIRIASASPISSQTSNSIQNSSSVNSRSTSVQTGDIVIHTKATDADGIAGEAAGSIKNQFRTAVENFDDGVAI